MTEHNLILAVIALGALLGGTLIGQVILYMHDKKRNAATLEKVQRETSLQSHLYNK